MLIYHQKTYAWTRIREPAKRPVKERQMIRDVIVRDIPWKSDPKQEPKRESKRNGFLP